MIEAEQFVRAARDRGFDLYAGVPCSYLKPFINYVIDADGALVWEGGEAHHIPPATNKLVDATGAGDSFAGGFLAKYLTGSAAADAARFATHISAWVIEHPGARPAPGQRLRAIISRDE